MSNEVIANYPKMLKAEMGKDAIIPGSAISPFKTSTPEGYEAEGGSSMEKVRTVHNQPRTKHQQHEALQRLLHLLQEFSF